MTIVFLILGFSLLVGVVLALDLLRPGDRPSTDYDLVACEKRLRELRSYNGVTRLFNGSDLDIVERYPVLFRRLTAQRRKAMRLYLREMRADFDELWSLCRFLAPLSRDEAMAGSLFRQFALFHALHAALQFRVVLGFQPALLEQEAGRLGDLLDEVRAETARALRSLDVAALPSAA